MKDYMAAVLVGNVVVRPEALQGFLKIAAYCLEYFPDDEKIVLTGDRGRGLEKMLEIRNAPFESAEKLAEGLGLKRHDYSGNNPRWERYVPTISFYDDGSESAETIRAVLLKRGTPFTRIPSNEGTGIVDGGVLYLIPRWAGGLQDILERIERVAKEYAEVIPKA